MEVDEAAGLRRALALARRGRPHPNPQVGAVVLGRGRIVGEGYHRRRGLDHAEVVALGRAGRRARGSTLIVTLEPCDHEGLTPPCTRAILAAGVQRVVVAAPDPDPRARGRGVRRLRRAGIDVVAGSPEFRAAADAINEAYNHAHRTGRPLVELKLAASLDGRLALRSGRSRWITGPAARREAHRLRARADAILVGGGTVRADDPALTVRHLAGPEPVRVVVSGRLDLPAGARVLDGRVPTWIVTGRAATRTARAARLAARRGVHVIGVGRRGLPGGRSRPGAARRGVVDLEAALEALAELGIRRLLVEGGVEIASGLLARGLVDRLHLHVAPIVLGGEHRGWPAPLGIRRLERALRLEVVRVGRLGADIQIEGRFR